MDALHTINNRYQVIQKLGEGGMGVVFLAYDRLNKKKVAIKKLHDTTSNMGDTSETREKISLAHEFQILAALKHPNIINVIDFGFASDSSPYFTMDYLEESPNIIGYGQSQPFSARIDLILQMLLALAYLHRNGIVHRDLKPDNALVNSDGKVQLLDFGIAVDNRYSIEKSDDYSVSGTLAYMAPEILEGQSATPASDLYAVGIMAYQLLANQYPFNLENITKLITDVIHTMPDISFLQSAIEQQIWNEQNNILPSSLDDLASYEMGDGFQTVTYERDNAPHPTQLNTLQMDNIEISTEFDDSEDDEKPFRNAIYFSDGRDVPDVANISNSLVDADYIFEVVAIINNLVMKNPHVRYQSATAVIEALCQALDRPIPDDVAIRESYLQGASFVGREDELTKMKTAISNMLNQSGSAWLIGGESGVGKSRFLDEVRVNALVSGVTVLNGQGLSTGGLLYQFWREPLRRLVLDADLQDNEASILKPIVPDITDLVDRPIPDASALEETGRKRLIDTIVQTFASVDQPLLLILEDLQWGKESLDVLKSLIPIAQTNKLLIVGSFSSDERPDLHEELSAMQYLHLGRLEHDAIEDLSISMLGESGKSQQIVDFLYQETEGNVFFLVETLRALAEEAGHLDFITEMTLPEKIFAGGIQQVIARRLGKVSPSLKVPLNISAIAGRYIDIKIISSIYPALDIDGWLTECSAASVLEVVEDKWRFTHEKIRDTLINDLDTDERTQAHHQIAQKFEKYYAQMGDYASLICDHYEQAGALNEASKWYIPAANYAKSVYLAASAITYFKKMLAYWNAHDEAEFALKDQMTAYAGLGKMYFWQANFDEAIATYEELAELANKNKERGEQAESLARIGLAHIFKGDLGKALEYVAEADKFTDEIDNRLQLTASLWVKGVTGYMQGEFDTSLEAGQLLMEIAEEFDSKQHMLQALYIFGGVYYTQGNYVEAAECFSRQYEIATEIGDQGPAMDALNNLGQVAEARGDYTTAYESYQEALAQIRKSGVRQPEILFMSNLGGVQVRREEYAEAIGTLEHVIQMAEEQSFGQLSETYRFLAEAFIGQESYASAYPAALQAIQLAQEVNLPDMIGGAYCVLGKVASLGQYEIELPNEDKKLSAEHCFAKSETIFADNGMIGNQARVLRDWSQHEQRQSNLEQAQELRTRALELFKQSGADLEVSRMEEEQ